MKGEKDFVFNVQAELVGAASLFALQGDDGHELSGVFILPCFKESGAVLFATNGINAFLGYDASGICKEPVRVNLHKDMIKACGCRVDVPKKRILSHTDMEYVRVATVDDEDGSSEWVEFCPAPASRAFANPGFDAFLLQHAQTVRPGIAAQSVNGNVFALMRKMFKDEYLFYPILHQTPAAKNDTPVFITFAPSGVDEAATQALANVMVITMPIMREDLDGDAYAGFSNLSGLLLSSPFAGGRK